MTHLGVTPGVAKRLGVVCWVRGSLKFILNAITTLETMIIYIIIFNIIYNPHVCNLFFVITHLMRVPLR